MDVLPGRILLITANVGTLFEESRQIHEPWLREVIQTIQGERASFIAIHMQEVGGKQYQISMEQVPDFICLLHKRLTVYGYQSGWAFMDQHFDRADTFTALGCVYLVHDSVLDDIEQYDFDSGSFQLLNDGFSFEKNAIRSDLIKMRFPQHFSTSNKSGRKGYLHTRWRLFGSVLDLVNVHLFHDESNLLTIDENPSFYSNNRKLALECVLDEVEKRKLNDSDEDFSPIETSLFIFGDFNFRLDVNSFVQKIAPETEKKPVLSETPSSSLEMNNVGKKHQQCSARIGCKGLQQQQQQGQSKDTGLRRTVSAVHFRKPSFRVPHSDSDKEIVLLIERKKFQYVNHNDLLYSWRMYLCDDKELKNFPQLFELNINFQPTYPWSEDPLESNAFMQTRAPAWCDRVLMDRRAYSLIQNESLDPPPVYNSIGRRSCMGDHKPVYLSLTLPMVDRRTTTAL